VRAVTVDTGTGAETPRGALSADLAQTGGGLIEWRLSRDGRYLLWLDDQSAPPIWWVSDLSGRRVRRWPAVSTSTLPIWLADGSGWLEGVSSSAVVMSGGGPMSCTLHGLTGADRKYGAVPGPFNWLEGATPDGRVIAVSPAPASGRPFAAGEFTPVQLAWYVYRLVPKPTVASHGVVAIGPHAAGVLEAESSPDGSRLACLVQTSYNSPLEALVSRFLRIVVQPHEGVDLWLVRLDGSGARLIGSEANGTPFGLLWTQDGKRLSFVDHGALWTVPADPR
jgi:hypothetical protein